MKTKHRNSEGEEGGDVEHVGEEVEFHNANAPKYGNENVRDTDKPSKRRSARKKGKQ